MKKLLLSLFCSLMAFTSIQAEEGWTLVTDASTLAIGDQIIIVAPKYDVALSTNQKDNNRGEASVTKDGESITFGSDVQIITLEAGTLNGTFAFNVGNGYLYAVSSNSNHLKTKTTLDANGSWEIVISEGIATIKAKGDKKINCLRYNPTSKLFSCYESEAKQKDISIYRSSDTKQQLTTPEISPSSCDFNDGENVEVTISAVEDATIYYTLDNNTPTEDSDIYSTPLTISATTTVKAIAVKDGFINSAVAQAKYTKIVSLTGSVTDAIAAYHNNASGDIIAATVTGYIVGVALGTIKDENDVYFGNNYVNDEEKGISTNILIADNADETDYTKCIPVQLPTGNVRNELNLVDNPDKYKTQVVLTGRIEIYYGVPGLKSVSISHDEEEPGNETDTPEGGDDNETGEGDSTDTPEEGDDNETGEGDSTDTPEEGDDNETGEGDSTDTPEGGDDNEADRKSVV